MCICVYNYGSHEKNDAIEASILSYLVLVPMMYRLKRESAIEARYSDKIALRI